MTTIGAYEAKTRFSELIARAEKGEEFEITKNGRPVAIISSVKAPRRSPGAGAALIERLKNLRGRDDTADLTWEDIKAMSDAGRPGCD